jgi:hypothetical protein
MDENQVAPAPQEQIAAPIDQQVPQAPQDGTQKRIDELTQKLREQERLAQEAYKTVAELAARDAANAQRQYVPQPEVDPLAAYREKVDPVALEAMQHMQNALERKFATQYAQLEANFGVQQIATEASAVQGLPSQVIEHAQKLYAQARAAGLKPSHDEAINYAIGAFVRGGGRLAAAPAQAPQYGSPHAVLQGQAPHARPATALPSGFDSMSRRDQLAIMRARFENEPL